MVLSSSCPGGAPFSPRSLRKSVVTYQPTLDVFCIDLVAGIADVRKVVHSLRHRSKDRLRAEGCPLDVQYELLGHETKTVASGYGHGSPVPLLRKWLDKIGL